MTQAPTRGTTTPLILSDRQGFDRRWYASGLKAVYVPTSLDQIAPCVEAALSAYGRDVKVSSGRHCYVCRRTGPKASASRMPLTLAAASFWAASNRTHLSQLSD